MTAFSQKQRIDRIKVQTARMLEAYSLLHSELERSKQLGISADDRQQLSLAIDTIAGSMRQLQEHFAEVPAENSAVKPKNIDEILDAVLKWQMAQAKD
ncbi:MAG: hypothetical protein FJY95_02095 [Candidatus Handelsmanbacteria bacterium]|nr:hypothetical protein [Candidatus Handelsmanbacteria bacterium]